jgi:hypothetical protein
MFLVETKVGMNTSFIYISNLIYLVIAAMYHHKHLQLCYIIYITAFILSNIYHYHMTPLTLFIDQIFAFIAIINNFVITGLKISIYYHGLDSIHLTPFNMINVCGIILCFSSLHLKAIQDVNYNLYHSLWHLISGFGAILLIV